MWWWLLPPLLWALEQAQAEEPGKLSQADDGGVPDGSFWAAYNRYTLEMPESVTVQEGLCVLVPCTFFHSGLQSSTDPVFGYWFLDGTNILYGSPVATNNPHRDVDMETRGRFQLVGDPQDNNCSLGIRDAKRKDMGRYFFRIQSRSVRHSYKDNQLSLSVTELTEVPVVDVPETLQSGRHSNLTCLVPWACEQGTPPVFSWSSSSPTVLEPGANPTPVLPITPSPEHHGANLTCQATFPGVGVTVERTVRLNVSYAPQNLSISVSRGAGTGSQVLANGSSLEVEEGESLCFTCIVTASHPPATLLWARDDLVLGPSQPSGNETLRLVWARAEDSGEYVCRAQNPLGTQDTSVVLLVKSPLKLLGPSCSWGAEGLHCTCASRAWPAPTLQWRLGEALLVEGSGNTSVAVTSSSARLWVNSSLSFRQGFSSSLRLSCEAQNAYGAQSAPVLLLLAPKDTKGMWRGMVQGAITGAGVTALFAAGLCLIFFVVKTCRRKSVKKTRLQDSAHPAVSSFFLGHLKSSSPPEGPPPGAATPPETTPPNETMPPNEARPCRLATPTDGEEPELHYASLSFGSLKPRTTQDQDSNTTEYAEVKIRKG
ncbi:sialic acid-binding Ig-like lectin 13 isoform X2 [Dipodomys spectabilis]|uniref:sialic acid-binding Ig-like lectin 13 isoform X2 n=1 Tax=Dipodomys spectabilis TaxID=105255 RepID=UPI001C548529|nr:sialic acid-binding Ig-like lectin 13 isoform X2 [Dipodomys spectabilis]